MTSVYEPPGADAMIPQEYHDAAAENARRAAQPHVARELHAHEMAAEREAVGEANSGFWPRLLDLLVPYRSRAIIAERKVSVLLHYNAVYIQRLYEANGALTQMQRMMGYDLAQGAAPINDKQKKQRARAQRSVKP